MEDIEELQAIHRASQRSVGVAPELHPGGTGGEIAAHRPRDLGDDSADETSHECEPNEEEGELHIGQELPGSTKRVQG